MAHINVRLPQARKIEDARDLQAKLFGTAPPNDREARRRTHQTSRLIAKLRGHRLIAKVGTSRLYRVTARGK